MDNIMQPIMTEYRTGAEWRLDGKFHRTDGPAIIWKNGDVAWFLHDIEMPFNEWLDQNPDMTNEEKVMMKLQYG
jgi:hypothetical protein